LKSNTVAAPISTATTGALTKVDPIRISVIIPTYNEESVIASLVTHLLANAGGTLEEVLVVDGGSTDQTVAEARKAGAQVHTSPWKGRADQMNHGAKLARGNVLYFVHADTRPPVGYIADIRTSLWAGYSVGGYRARFEAVHPLLALNSYFSRFNRLTCRGGDQTLFVTRALFDTINGYDNYYVVMEDFDFIRRARRQTRFQIMPREAEVSARKYQDNNYGRVTVANFIVFTMFRLGFSPRQLLRTYRQMVWYPRSGADGSAGNSKQF
jgi:rSAM/selenodomain-associated transferase 2